MIITKVSYLFNSIHLALDHVRQHSNQSEDLFGSPVMVLTYTATSYLDVSLTFDLRLCCRLQPADLSNGPLYSCDP